MRESTSEFFARVLGDRTNVAKELANIHDLAWEVTNKDILGLCKLRIAMILGSIPYAIIGGFLGYFISYQFILSRNLKRRPNPNWYAAQK